MQSTVGVVFKWFLNNRRYIGYVSSEWLIFSPNENHSDQFYHFATIMAKVSRRLV